MIDSREIAKFEEVAAMRSKAASTIKQKGSESESDVEGFEADLTTKRLEETKPYMKLEEVEGGDLRIHLFLPPYNLNDL